MHAINLDHVIPYYNPTNIPFKHNQSTRKSFNRGTPKTKLVLKSNGNNNNDFRSGSLTSGKEMSSPSSLSFEMIEESIDEIPIPQTSTKNEYAFENLARTRESSLFSLPGDNYNGFMDVYQTPMPPDNGSYFDNSSNDLDYYPERSVEPEREDFPVNNAQQPDYAPKMDGHSSSVYNNAPKIVNKSKPAAPRKTLSQQSALSRSSLATSKKFSTSNIDLHSIDDNGSTFGGGKKMISSRNGSPTRNYSAFNNNNNNNHKAKRSEPKEINHARNNRKITVQILAKPPPPTRSKTSLDLKSSSSMSHTSLPMASSSHLNSTLPSMPTSAAAAAQPKAYGNQNYNGHGSAEENAEISVLTAYHERVHQQLSTRYATLQLVRNSTR